MNFTNTLYPNGYINLDQHGNYTKHYYADDQRIASKIGSGITNHVNGSTADSALRNVIRQELANVTHDSIEDIVYPFPKISYLTYEIGIPIEIPLGPFTLDTNSFDTFGYVITYDLYPLEDSGVYEDGLFFYHFSHTASNQLVTNLYGDIAQAIVYNAWGAPIAEYKQDWHQGEVPDFQMNASEKDAESGLNIMGVRYYSDVDLIFTSRDVFFEKYYWTSSYTAFLNSPLRFVDPTGMVVDEGSQAEWSQIIEK